MSINRLKHYWTALLSPGVLAFAALLQPFPVAAQNKQFNFELTPYAAYRLGGQFEEKDGDGQFEFEDSDAQGIMLSGLVRSNTQWEVLYGRQNTDVDTQGLFVNDPLFDLDVEYFHFGGTYLFEGDNVRPFIALTVGVSQFDPGPDSFDSESFFSASIGGGWQLNASKRIGVRLEARAFTTFVESDSDIFCQSSGAGGTCLIAVDAKTLTQWEARAGLVFRF